MTVDLKSLFDPAAVSDETRAFNERLEAELALAPDMTQFPPELVRQTRLEGKGALPLGGPLEGSEWREIPGATDGPGRVRISEPAEEATGIFLHIHGGGWTIGAPDQYDKTCQQVAAATGMRVVSVAYRLAPEHPWPAQREDCMAAARWALAEWDLPMVISGESAGGHLTVVTALGLREEGLIGRVSGLIPFYGVFDLRATPSVANWGKRLLILSGPIMDWFIDFLDPDDQARHQADLSVISADVTGMPPALFIVGTADPLLDDTLFMAMRWQSAGNRTELKVYPGGVHAFDQFDELQIAHDSRDKAAVFAKACIG